MGINDGRGPVLSRNWGGLSDDPKFAEFLLARRGQARFLLATPTALLAAPIIIRTGQPVMAMGGFSGRDPILTVEALAKIARRGEVRYVLVGGQSRPGVSALVSWVRQNGMPVAEAEWRSLPAEPRRPLMLYELKAGD